MSAFARIMSVVCALLLLAPVGMSQTTVAVSPSSKTTNLPQQFTLNVNIAAVTNLGSASIKVAYDHNILQYDNVTQGAFLSGAFMFSNVVVGAQYDVLTVDQSLGGTTGKTGSGTLITLYFTAKAVGTTPITLQLVDLRDKQSPPQSIASTNTSGQVTVDPPLPVTLVSFVATATAENYPMLSWKTLSEIDNYGFTVQRKGAGNSEFVDLADGFVAGHGTTIDPHEYSYTDKTAGPGDWSYRLKQTDVSGPVHYSNPVQISVVTSVEEQGLPTIYSLEQNYPNPFNPTTVISYQLPTASHVRLVILDVLGREVAVLVNGNREPGFYKEPFNAAGLSSGLYFYQLKAGEQTFLKKMALVK